MIVIPAIDLIDGQCVRLFQGKREAVTTYSNDPGSMAKRWKSFGAELIHIVDLDGAFTGNQANLHAIKKIRQSVQIPLQVGGGIRNTEGITRLFSLGIERVILGTAAIEDPEFVKSSCGQYPGRILIGIDAKDGMVAVKGWKEVTSLNVREIAGSLEDAGAAGIIYTDIARDGTLSGPNVKAVQKMVESVKVPVTAAGGVSNIEDIKNLMGIRNLWGVITGKAIYAGTLDLKEAIKAVRSSV
jgi:phosphoribosylformimino-5-aminoimidazole carboxamide ribotide isomerase